MQLVSGVLCPSLQCLIGSAKLWESPVPTLACLAQKTRCRGKILVELQRWASDSSMTQFSQKFSQLLDDLSPPTRILRKFLKTWADREETRSAYALTAQQSVSNKVQADAAEVALTLSRRLIAILRAKKVMNMEAGLEMMALAITISSEVC
jgi:hypothetical protein